MFGFSKKWNPDGKVSPFKVAFEQLTDLQESMFTSRAAALALGCL